MFRKSAIAAALLVFGSAGVFALGLGDISMKSMLNQTMQAEIDLTSARDTELGDIKISLASLEAHQRVGINKSAVLASFKFAVEKTPSGNVVVKVTSTEAIREPFLEFLLELEWPKGRLMREYTVLVDPPVTMPAVPAAPSAPVSRAATPLAGPAPARRMAAPVAPVTAPATLAAAPAVADSYGPVRRSDTLWSIADQTRPDRGVSIHQMMQALLRANPDAFIGNNINNMKAGVTLKIPERSEILSMSARAAAAESRRQYAEWQAASAAPVAAQPVAAAENSSAAPNAADTAGESAAPAQAAAAVQAESGTHLSLVAPEDDSISGAAAPGEPGTEIPADSAEPDLNKQLTLATEEAAASRAQSTELQSRVDELEQQVDTMKRLLELKDHALAQLQNRSSNATAEPAAAETAPDASETATTVTPAPVVAQEAPRDLVKTLTSNPVFAAIGAALALLVAGLLWLFVRRRAGDDPDDDMTLQSHLARSNTSAYSEPRVVNVRETEYEDEEEEPVISEVHDHNPLTEADVFLAYGRIQQAEETLKSAMHNDPDNEALQLKLLEVYHAAGNVAAFEQAASEYRNGLDEDDSRWLKVASMGYSLVPRNELFSAAAEPQRADADTLNIDLSQVGQPGRENPVPDMPEGLEFALDAELAGEEEDQDGILASEDEVTTKLDLARAYIDMDDRDSARSILDEVMEEGNNGQKEEAERIIARLA